MKQGHDRRRSTRGRAKPQSALRGALDELGLTDPFTGKRLVRKGPITVKALRERNRKP
jgi:hypothetical protein